MKEPKKYYAFISYKREDKRYAVWLQHKLEYYKLPVWIRKRNIDLPEKIRPIFRDVTDLSGGVLEKAIQDGLENSRYLIVICSPSAANSVWVGKEVQAFIDAKRESQIIPFIIDGIPNSGDPRTECYPVALRNLTGSRELLGINVHDSGRRAAFIKVVATMFGLRFDELWGRYRRQLIIRRVWLSIVGILALIGLFLTFDYFRTKSVYYADYEICRGMPTGILPLTTQEVAERLSYYRFEFSRRQLRRVVYCNRWGQPTNPGGTGLSDRYAIQEIGYENGVFTSVTQCDAEGSPQYKEVYNPPHYNRVDLKNHDTGDAANLLRSYTSIDPFRFQEEPFNPNMLTMTGKAAIGRYVIDYDDYGYIERKMFKRYNGDNSHVGRDNNGVCGLRYVRDAYHRIVEQYYLDESGYVMADKFGVAGRKYKYDVQGNICEDLFVGLDGKPVLNELLYARGVSEFLPGGRVVKSYYGVDGKPCLNKYGFASSYGIIHEDSVQAYYLGLSGEPVLYWDAEHGMGGYHKIVNLVNKKGFAVEESYYGVDSLPVYIQPGLHRVVFDVDDKGRPVRSVAYGIHGKKVNTRFNYCEVRCKYEDGKMVEQEFYDSMGRRVNSISNYSKVTSRYENGLLVERFYYDRNDIPAVSSEIMNTSGLQMDYDDRGNVVEVRMLNSEGGLMVCMSGFAQAKMKYDEVGNCQQVAFYDTEGELTLRAGDGVSIIKNEYNPDGTISRRLYYNADNQLFCNNFGIAVEEYEYNLYGMPVEHRIYDENHRLVNGPFGWAIMRWEYRNNRCVSVAVFDNQDKPIIEKTAGCHRLKFEYDRRGYLESTTCWDEEGLPMMSATNGYWKYEQLRNLRGFIVEERSYGVDDRLIVNKSGAAVGKMEYTDQGNIKRLDYYDENEKLVINKNLGYSSCVNTWNELGLPLTSACFGVKGEPVNNNIGYHKVEDVYDDNGKLLMIVYRDKNQHLCLGPLENSRIYGAIQKLMYDENGDLCYSVIFDEDRKVLCDEYSVRDSLGNVDHYIGKRNDLMIYELDNQGNTKSYFTEYFGLNDSIRHLTDSLNHLLDSLESKAKFMYEGK